MDPRNKEVFQRVIKELDFIENLFDCIRLVDPREKAVYGYFKAEEKVSENLGACYSIWEEGKICENCISMRAYNQKRTIIKIENVQDRIFTVTAVPVDFGDSLIVVELLKDITDDGIIDIAGMGISEISKLISHRNSLMIKDALTKIYNELYIDERLPHDLLKANRKNHSLIVFRLTVQNINSINTTYGYDAGDYILKEIAKVMKDFPRTSEDWVSRYQGIEFILVMHQITENQAKRICSRIDKKIRGLEPVFNNQNIAVNVKIGFAGLQGESTPRELIEMAEKNDYRTNEFTETNTNVNKELFRKAQLTPREIEVALLLLQGESNNNIAKTLYVGLSTVKKHISSIFEKTNVKSRAEFIYKARLN